MATATKTPTKPAAKTAAKPAAKSTSTAVAVKKSTGGLVSVQDMMAAQLAALQGKTAPAGGNSIRVTQDKKFVMPDGSSTSDPINAVILDFTSYNTFYEDKFDKNNIVPPTCFAIGDIPLKLVPSDNSPVKQADTCAECPMNVFGSDGDGKACKNSRLLAVQLAVPDPDNGGRLTVFEDTPIWTIKVSPTAIKGYDGYVKTVARVFQAPPVGVLTQISFDENRTYASLTFGEPQPNEDLEVCVPRIVEAKEMLIAEPDVSGYGQQKAAPAKKSSPVRRR